MQLIKSTILMNHRSLGLIYAHPMIWSMVTCLEGMKSIVFIARTVSHTMDIHGKRVWNCLNPSADFYNAPVLRESR